MITQNLLHASESYTHKNWVYKNICTGFSRMYYIIDGTAFYEEDGNKIKLKKNHLYFTPVKKEFSLFDDPSDHLLHTYVHITTSPPIVELVEIEVKENTPLYDAVALLRKYIHLGDFELLTPIINLVLSLVNIQTELKSPLSAKTKKFIDDIKDYSFDMNLLCKEMGYGREHIIRSFSAAYGLTPKKYFNVIRMNVGLEQLIYGKSVTEVSILLNFSSPYAFSKAFKNHFGMSPEKYLAFKAEAQRSVKHN